VAFNYLAICSQTAPILGPPSIYWSEPFGNVSLDGDGFFMFSSSWDGNGQVGGKQEW